MSLINKNTVLPGFTHVAWMGGSFSPPTSAHFTVAMAMGKALVEKGGDCAICIVPVSQDYNKLSVKEECVPNEVRFELVKALVDALNSENTHGKLTFFLSNHEYNSPKAVATIDSLGITKQIFPGATIYIAQGQDNIEAIFRRKWVRSDELLTYGFIVYPRGSDTDIKQPNGPLDTALQSSQEESKNKAFAPPLDRESILSRTSVIPVDFNDDNSSSLVRKMIRKKEDIQSLFHNTVYVKFQELLEKYPWMYGDDDCEPEDKREKKGGYRRKMSRRKQYRKRKTMRRRRQ